MVLDAKSRNGDNKVNERTDDAIRIAIAEWMGDEVAVRLCLHDPECGGYYDAEDMYADDPNDSDDDRAYHAQQRADIENRGKLVLSKRDGVSWVALPDYLTDLNAVREVEKELERRGLHHKYAVKLWSEYGSNGGQLFNYLSLSARQRCTAILAVIEQSRAPVGEGQTVTEAKND